MTVALLAACGGGPSKKSASSEAGESTVATVARTTASAPVLETLTQLVARTKSGIVRIEGFGCQGEDIGTGFLVGPQLVATVEHVVDGAERIKLVRHGKTIATGVVVGEDATRDVALVRTSKPLKGYEFAFSSKTPALGDSVAALGFPLGLPLSLSQGTISGTDRTISIGGVSRHKLVQTDAPVNPGNSGGPLLSIDTGKVVGLIDLGTTEANGIAFAVASGVAEPLIEAWKAAPQTMSSSGSCGADLTASAAPDTASAGSSSASDGPLAALDGYWSDIASGDYVDAFGYLEPGKTTRAGFVQGEEEAGVTEAEWNGEITAESDSHATVDVDFLQTVDVHYGCRTWTGSYDMVQEGGAWYIRRAAITPHSCGD